MLEIQQLAVYWNSNASENWSKNKEFQSSSAQRLIDHSKKFSENLKKRHQHYQNQMSNNNIFVIQPCDIRIRFRKNLSPSSVIEVPRSTISFDVSSLLLTVDEEMYKDIQYMMKFFSWHQKAFKENKHFKFRPAYNVPALGNAQAYWRYAITSTMYLIKKGKREKTLKQKRQQEILELSQLFVMVALNNYFERSGAQQRLLESNVPENPQIALKFQT